jgi:hypothetical protein
VRSPGRPHGPGLPTFFRNSYGYAAASAWMSETDLSPLEAIELFRQVRAGEFLDPQSDGAVD